MLKLALRESAPFRAPGTARFPAARRAAATEEELAIALETCHALREAAALLGRAPAARFLGGGTLLVRALNEGEADFSTLVRCLDPALAEIRASGPRIRIGAAVTMARILAARELDFLHPAARSVGGPAVRAQATLGGNLFAPPPYGDLCAALLALDARVSVHSGYSARDVSVEDFLRERGNGAGRTLVTGVELTRPRDSRAFRFLKVSKVRPRGVSMLTIAARLEESGGRLSGARVAYANMAPAPARAAAVERALEGRRLDRTGIEAAAAVASEGFSPPTDALASSWYRRAVAPVHLSRLLSGAPDGSA